MTTNLAQILTKYKRIVIAGGPKTGKTTLASAVTDREVFHTDDFIGRPWEEIPYFVIDQVKNLTSYVIEGIQAGRALRKGLKPDVVIYLTEHREPLTPRQQGMGKGCEAIFHDWLSTSTIPVIYNVKNHD